MLKASLLLVAAVAGVKLMSVETTSEYTREVETWRAERVARLEAPRGWLSLVGLHWLKEGANTVGSGKDNAIVLAKGPETLGVVTLKDGKVSIALDPDAGATIDGRRETSAVLRDDSRPNPTVVEFGTVGFYAIRRGERIGLRVKDTEAPARTRFLGIDYFPIDPSWRIVANWVPFEPAHQLEVPNVLGDVDEMPVPGKAVFERDGKTYELLPVLEDPDADSLFFILADRTNGKQTYGAGRFLYTGMPEDGKLVIDFNRAYNPPCAFTPFATCPLAPPENRLDLAVTAGEKKYRGGH